jgi:hypothetical protein
MFDGVFNTLIMDWSVFIGEKFRYPTSDKIVKLKSVTQNSMIFECGHWCTDNVFIDMYRLKNGKQVSDHKIYTQLTLF